MLSLSRGLLIAALSVGYIAWHGSHQTAFAKGDDDDDGGGDDDSGDDSDSGDNEDDGGDDGDQDKDQPAVTAGGLFTMKTYPVRELDRPLTMTKGIGQLRAGVGTDVSAHGAFETYGINLEARYGYKDNVTLLGGFTSAYNVKQFGFYGGFEGALAYDLVDFKAAFRVNRPAAPDPTMAGKYVSGDTSAGIDIGFPFRYVAKPEIAIVALDTLMSIDFDSKPDLRPSLGISTNPVPPLSVVIFAQLIIPDFNTDASNFVVPATARFQFTPNQKFDVGAEFTFLNIKPPEGVKFYDNRFLTFFIQSRFGK